MKLLLIIILGAFLRFYLLLDYPVQLNHDEVTQLYDAISIAQTGKDIYGNFLPFIFFSIGDFKPPFYTYMTSLFYFLFGGGELTIRLTGAIFGTLLIPAVFLFVLRLLKNKEIAIFSAIFAAITPFELFFSRKSFENGAGIFLMLLGFSCIFIYLENRKKRWFYLATIIFSAAIYTYFSHAIIIPLLLISFFIIFKKHFLDFRKYIFPFLIFISLVFPLLFMIVANPDTRYRSTTVFVTQDINLGKQIEYGNKYKAILDFSFNRYLDQFNSMYLFGNGLDLTHQGPIGVGPLLFIQLPLLFLGIVYLVRQAGSVEEKRFILFWILLGALPSGLTFEQHSPHRIVMVFTMLNIISAIGLYYFFKKVKKFGPLIWVIFIFNMVYFIHIYYVNFPYEKSQYLHYPFKQVSEFAWSQYGNVDGIIFDPLYGETNPMVGTGAHYYLAYYGGYSPVKFQKEFRRGDKGREVLFDKFSIRKLDWREDQYLKNVLIIASPWSLPVDFDKTKVIKTFYFYNHTPAFYAIKL